MRPSRSASSHSAGPHPVVAGRRRVALVEDQVDDLEHRREALAERRRRAAPRTARCASASVRLARTMRCAIVGSGTRNARAISSVVRPPSRRSVSATRASVESTGWQRVKISRSRSSPMSSSGWRRLGRASCRPRSRARVRPASPASSSAAAQHGRSRGAWRWPSARRPGCPGRPPRPLLERRDQRVLRELLGAAHVAHHAREARDQPRRFDAPDGLDGAVGGLARRVRSARRGSGGRAEVLGAWGKVIDLEDPATSTCRPRQREARRPLDRLFLGRGRTSENGSIILASVNGPSVTLPLPPENDAGALGGRLQDGRGRAARPPS